MKPSRAGACGGDGGPVASRTHGRRRRGEPRGRGRARSAMRQVRTLHCAVGLVLALVAGTLALPAFADDYKIGVIHVERILQQSQPAKAAHDRIEQEFKARDADIARKEQEVRQAGAQLEKDRATLTAEERASRERALELRTRDVQRLRQQFAEDLRARQFEELDKLKERLDKALTSYAKERNFDLILQDALFVGRTVDVTDDVIRLLDAQ